MGIFKEVKRRARFRLAQDRAQESALYAQVMDELDRGERDKGLWGKALAETDGDEAKANARYLKLRASALADLLNVAADFQEQQEETAAAREKAAARATEEARRQRAEAKRESAEAKWRDDELELTMRRRQESEKTPFDSSCDDNSDVLIFKIVAVITALVILGLFIAAPYV